MDKEIIRSKLEKFNYYFIERHNSIFAELDYSLEMEIDFNDENKIEIKDKLKSWNFLTGTFEMSVKSSLIFNTVFSFILALLFLFINLITESKFMVAVTLLAFILGMFWILLWTTFFIIKAENFRRFIESIEK